MNSTIRLSISFFLFLSQNIHPHVRIRNENLKHLTYISLSSYLVAKLCRTPGSCKYDNFVMSSTPPGGASVSFGKTFEIFVTTYKKFSSQENKQHQRLNFNHMSQVLCQFPFS